MSFPCLYIKQVKPFPPPSKITPLTRYFQVSLHTHVHLMLCCNDFLLKGLFVSVFLLTNRDSKREKNGVGFRNVEADDSFPLLDVAGEFLFSLR